MKKNRKILITVSGIAIILLLILFLARLISYLTYRDKIPTPPDLSTVSASLGEQQSDAYSKAYRHPVSDNLGMLGMVYHSGTYYDKAAECYRLAALKDKKQWIWSYYLGVLSQEMGDPHAAIKNFREVERKNNDIFLALYYEGECYQKAGLSDSAELTFTRIIRRMNKNAVVKTAVRYDYFPLVTYAMYDLARIYLNTQRLDTAEKTLRDIIDYQRAFGPAYRLLGNLYSIRGNEELSNRYLVRAGDLTVNPTPVDTLADRLSLLSRSDMYLLKRIDEAEKSVFPEYALELVTHSLAYFPENNYLVAKAIKLFLIRDMGAKALPYLDQHINYFRKDFNELKSVGDLLYNKGFYSEAMNYYSAAEQLKPADNQVKSCIIICLSKEGRKEQAINSLTSLINKNKDDPSFIADGVTLFLSLGEKEEAVRWLSRLRTLNPSFPKGHQLAGMLAEQESDWKGAISDYTVAFNLDPSDLTTGRLLGNLLIRQKMWDKAIAHFKKALELHPNEPFFLERLGTILVTCNDPKLRDIEEGKDLCERAFIHTSSHSVTLISAGRSLALAYALTGDRSNAANVIRMTINLAQNERVPSVYLNELKNMLQEFNK